MGKQGGRPIRLGGKARARRRRLLASGKSLAECASILGVSVHTVSRAVAREEGRERTPSERLYGSGGSACSKAGTGVFFDDLYYIPV